MNKQQCVNVNEVVYDTQVQEVVEEQCRQVPDKECVVQTVNKPQSVNSTECKDAVETKCTTVNEIVNEQVCNTVSEKVCRKVPQKSVQTVQVNNKEKFKIENMIFMK